MKKSEKMTNNLAKYGERKRKKIIQVPQNQENLTETESNTKTKMQISFRKCNGLDDFLHILN